MTFNVLPNHRSLWEIVILVTISVSAGVGAVVWGLNVLSLPSPLTAYLQAAGSVIWLLLVFLLTRKSMRSDGSLAVNEDYSKVLLNSREYPITDIGFFESKLVSSPFFETLAHSRQYIQIGTDKKNVFKISDDIAAKRFTADHEIWYKNLITHSELSPVDKERALLWLERIQILGKK